MGVEKWLRRERADIQDGQVDASIHDEYDPQSFYARCCAARPTGRRRAPARAVDKRAQRARRGRQRELYNRRIYWNVRAIDRILPFDVLPCGAPNPVIRAIEVPFGVGEKQLQAF